jgi:hypothetical protein
VSQNPYSPMEGTFHQGSFNAQSPMSGYQRKKYLLLNSQSYTNVWQNHSRRHPRFQTTTTAACPPWTSSRSTRPTYLSPTDHSHTGTSQNTHKAPASRLTSNSTTSTKCLSFQKWTVPRRCRKK